MPDILLVILLVVVGLPLWFVLHTLTRLSFLRRSLEEVGQSLGAQLSAVRRELALSRQRYRRLRRRTRRLARHLGLLPRQEGQPSEASPPPPSASASRRERPVARSARRPPMGAPPRPVPAARPIPPLPPVAPPAPSAPPVPAAPATAASPLPSAPPPALAPEGVEPAAAPATVGAPEPSPPLAPPVPPSPAVDGGSPLSAAEPSPPPSPAVEGPPPTPPSPPPVPVPPVSRPPSRPRATRRARLDPETMAATLENPVSFEPLPGEEAAATAAGTLDGRPPGFGRRPPPDEPPPAGSSWFEQLRASLSGEEWEAVVGGSWLNKLGALILVIGLALFLNYSYGHLGPAGRVATGYAVGLALLGAGLWLERQERYQIFTLGLKGGGWAALYYTSYAVHAIDASRLIESPALGMLLLVGVAAAMIAHALQYRSEPMACLAYFIGYATLVISPRSDYSLLASLPLLASLLIASYRREWDQTPLLGLILSYACYALGYGDVFWRPPLPGALVSGKAILVVHWLAFEAFDLLEVARGRRSTGAARAVFPVNAVGFIGVALLHAPSGDPYALPHFLAMTGAGYLVSTLIRAWLRPPAGFAPATPILERALAGSYEGAVSLTTGLLAVALWLRFTGFRLIAGSLLLVEMLFVTGRQTRQSFLRLLGLLVYELGALYGFHLMVTVEAARELFGLTMKAWTPGLGLLIAVGYLDALLLPGEPAEEFDRQSRAGFSVAATLLAVLCLASNLRGQLHGVAWLALAMILLEVARRTTRPEFAWQAYGLGALAAGTMVVQNLARDAGPAAWEPWVALGGPVLLTGFTAWRLRFGQSGNLPLDHVPPVSDLSADVAVGALLGLLWHLLPPGLVALGWGVVAVVAGEIGYGWGWPRLRLHLQVVLALTFGRAVMANFTLLGDTAGLSHRVLTVVPLLALFIYEWLRGAEEASASASGSGDGDDGAPLAGEPSSPGQAAGQPYPEPFRPGGMTLAERDWQWWWLYPPTIMAAMLFRFEFGRVGMVTGWALLTVGLVAVGRRARLGHLRAQSYLLAVMTFLRCWGTDFLPPSALPGEFDPNRVDRLLAGFAVVLAFFIAQFQLPRREDPADDGQLYPFDRQFRSAFCVMGALILTKLIYHEVSGHALSIAWGCEAALLLAAGFALRDRPLRLSGLFLLFFCVLKLLVYDFANLEGPWRYLSFCLVGALVMGISWAYSRFRDKLREYF